MNDYIDLKNRINASKVLLVEDEKIILQEECLFFRKFFSTVDTARNGAEGVDKFEKGDYEIIFSDVKMPVMNGWEMSEKIRKINPNVFVVMISASQDHNDDKHQYDLYLKKPLSFKVMIHVIKEIIRKLKL